ncbi:transcriptional regulator [filamentous cyanobacterium CCT1]|nr:transcriptional regulator [filamentous cyanobacterium CCT1]PSN81634.1 transcriptional regulator [filamentous cyanobacterium CCP4]
MSTVASQRNYLGIGQPAIGRLIREIRQTLELTQEKFAAQLGVSLPTINRWENGQATPSSLALRQIESLLDQLVESPDRALREYSQVIRGKYLPSRTQEA